MSEVRSPKGPLSIESLQSRFEALKEGSEELKGVVFTERVGGKIPETKDLWLKVVLLEPKPLSISYLYGVAHTLIRLQDLEDRLDLYENKEPSDRMRLAVPPRILWGVAEGRVSRNMLLQILVSTVRPKPSVKAKEEIPVDWPFRQKELAKRHNRVETQSSWAGVTNWLSRWWRGAPVSYSPIEQNWVRVFPELNQ